MDSVARVLSRVLRDLGLEQDVRGWQAVEEWALIVGPRMAGHTRAIACRNGTLHVEVEGSAWMHELGFLKRQLIERINARLGGPYVRDVRFVMPRQDAPPRR
jgi:predicted nucleic acid-binding Zn ribbon protein